MTNYKKIKKMSKKKMLEFLLRYNGACETCVYVDDEECRGEKCRKGVRKWLESEAEE